MMKVMEAPRRGVPERHEAKSTLLQHDPWHVPDKQIHRWEGEGGAEYLPRSQRRPEN
ncbi:hypothetical protein Q9Q76_20465 [Mycobacterium intracellulare]|uniref:hypothetical protein n=2 Tax=Mycobacterium intracellulare TaxID=1767 RepID=UPI00334D637E